MKQKASFTIEATIWVSLILCMVVGVLQKGIDYYDRHAKRTVLAELEEWNSVSRFYEVWMLKEFGEEEVDE